MKTTLTAIAIIAASMVFANGATIVASGTLTTANGLTGTGDWAEDAILTYKVTRYAADDFRYDYALTVPRTDVSHVISQICEGWTIDRPEAETGRYSGDDPSNPNLPSEFYGLKVEASNTLFEWYVTAPTSPTNGHFYAKGGSSHTVWTTGLDGGSSYLPVPDCAEPVTEVPEPSSLLFTSAAGLLLLRRKRRQ